MRRMLGDYYPSLELEIIECPLSQRNNKLFSPAVCDSPSLTYSTGGVTYYGRKWRKQG